MSNSTTQSSAQRYRLVSDRALREGGQGEVFLAEDTNLGRFVLIKKLRSDCLVSASAEERFRQEARITSRLRHPGIVTVHDFFEDDAGDGCCVMEFVAQQDPQGQLEPAKTLADVLTESQGVPVDRRDDRFRRLLNILVSVCKTLHCAHQQKIVHRDVKCSNILVGPNHVVVIDWGVSKVMGEQPINSSGIDPTLEDGLTSHGQQLGTPSYRSPEQTQCSSSVDPRTDIFSLGIILHRMLTGALPARDCDIDDGVSGHTALARTPRALREIFYKATRQNPAERYVSAMAMAEDVERWLSDRPVTVYRDNLANFWRAVRAHQLAATVVGTLTLAVLVGISLFSRAQAVNLSRTQELSGKIASQLRSIQRRQYSASLREATRRIREYDPGSAAKLLNDPERCPPASRGFTWRLLSRATEDAFQTVTVKQMPRLILPSRPDESRVVVASRPGLVEEWSLSPLQRQRVLIDVPQRASAMDCQINETDTLVAVGFHSGRTMVVDLAGNVLADWKPNTSPTRLVKFAKAGTQLITISEAGAIRRWSFPKLELLYEYLHDRSVHALACSTKHDLVFAGREDGAVDMIDLRGELQDGTLGGMENWSGGLTLCDDGARLAVCDRIGVVYLFDLAAMRGLREPFRDGFRAGARVEIEYQFSQPLFQYHSTRMDNRRFVVTANRREGLHLTAPTGDVMLPVEFSTGIVKSTIAHATKQRRIMYGYERPKRGQLGLGVARLRPLGPSLEVQAPLGQFHQAVDFAWLGADKLVWGAMSGMLKFVDVRTGSVDSGLTGDLTSILSVSAYDARQLAVLRGNGRIEVWDGTFHIPIKYFHNNEGHVRRGVQFLSANRLAIREAEGIRICDAETGKETFFIDALQCSVLGSMPDQRRLVYADRSRPYKLSCIDWHTGEKVWDVGLSGRRPTQHIVVSPDGRRFVSVGPNGRVDLRNSSDGRLIRTLIDLAGPAMGIEFSPDGRTLAVVNRSGQLVLLDAELGEHRATLQTTQPRISGLKFSPDGSSLAVLTRGGVNVWRLD